MRSHYFMDVDWLFIVGKGTKLCRKRARKSLIFFFFYVIGFKFPSCGAIFYRSIEFVILVNDFSPIQNI